MTDKPPTNLYTALLSAQRAMGPVKKDATNPAFRSKYATLQSVIETIEEPLHTNGLVLVQRLQYDRIGRDGSAGEGTPILITELIHAASGEKLDSHVPIVCKDPLDPQKVGGALTYFRRYSLLALLNLAPEDDDGHAASQPTPPPANQPARQRAASVASLSASPTEPRPAAAPSAAAGPPPPAPEPPYTDREFDAIKDKAWGWAEDGWKLDDIRNDLNKLRHRMSKEQRTAVVTALAKIEAEHYAPASVAG